MAVLDHMLATDPGTSVASVLLGVVKAFMIFDFDQHQVHVSKDATPSDTAASARCEGGGPADNAAT